MCRCMQSVGEENNACLLCLTGTIWMQQILLLLEANGEVTAKSGVNNNSDLMPWIEVIGSRQAFIMAPSPRMRVTHLLYQFMPLALRQKKGKVSSPAG